MKKPNIKLNPNCKVYAVGGCVRDFVLGNDPKDIDYVVVGATEQDMLDAGLKRVGSSFHVYLNEAGDEFALARTERKQGNGYKGFVTTVDNVTLEDDLKRRDFTINTLCFDFELGTVIDPMGGLKDIHDKVLRMVNPDAFHEDPLRVLRLARFASRFPDFSIDPATVEAIVNMPNLKEEIASIPIERVNLEFEKMWEQCAVPRRFFDTLDDCHVLDLIIPELHALKGVKENPVHHPEGNTYEHTMLALQEARNMYLFVDEFWMVLTHDFGKVVTADTEAHHDHDKDGVDIVDRFSKRFRLSLTQQNLCKLFCEHHMRLTLIKTVRPFTIAKMFNVFKVDHSDFILTRMVWCSFADQFGRDKECVSSFDLKDIFYYLTAYRSVTGKHLVELFKGREKPLPKGEEFQHELSILKAKEISKVHNR